MKSVTQTVIEADRFYTIAAHTLQCHSRQWKAAKLASAVPVWASMTWPSPGVELCPREGDGVYRIRNRASVAAGSDHDWHPNGTWLHLWEDVGGVPDVEGGAHPGGTVRCAPLGRIGKCVDTVGISAEVGAVPDLAGSTRQWRPAVGHLWGKGIVKRAAKSRKHPHRCRDYGRTGQGSRFCPEARSHKPRTTKEKGRGESPLRPPQRPRSRSGAKPRCEEAAKARLSLLLPQ